MAAIAADPPRRHLYAAATLAVASLACTVAFLAWFDWRFHQPGTVLLWVSSIGLLLAAVHCAERRFRPPLPSAREAAVLAGFFVLFVASWLPFWDDWRWAQTGDSIAWYSPGLLASSNRMIQNLLSIHGPDGNSTFLSVLTINLPMFLFEPNFFWHRVGKLWMSCLSLVAIYAFFRTVLDRRWALIIMFCVATNYVWQRYSHMSDHLILSYAFSYSCLTLGVLIWRHPERIAPWAWCGMLTGLALFYPQSAFAELSVLGLFLAGLALWRWKPAAAFAYAAAFLLAALPILLQIEDFVQMNSKQASAPSDWEYTRRTFATIWIQPYWSPARYVGVANGYMREPLNWTYFGGLAIAAVSLVPAVRRRLRLPAVVAVLGLILAWDIALLTITNNQYGLPSPKRSVHILPLYVFMALLPGYALVTWLNPWRWARAIAWTVVVGAVAFTTAAQAWLIYDPPPFIYGDTMFDGMIEMRQRFPDLRAILLTSRPTYLEVLRHEDFYHQAYGVRDQFDVTSAFDATVVERACAEKSLLCYEANWLPDVESFRALMTEHGHRFDQQPMPLLNSRVLWCYRCVDPPPAG